MFRVAEKVTHLPPAGSLARRGFMGIALCILLPVWVERNGSDGNT